MRVLLELLKKDLGLYSFNLVSILRDRKKILKLLLAPLIIFILGVYIYIFNKYMLSNFHYFLMMKLENVFLMQGFYAFVILTVIFSVPYLIAKLYYSNDTTILLPLPLKRSTLMMSKLISLSVSNLSLGIFLTIPMMVKYGQHFEKSYVFYIIGILGMIALSLITTGVISIFVVLVMRGITKLSVGKKTIQFMGMLLMLLLSLAINFGIQSSINNSNIQNLASLSSSILKRLYVYMPHLKLMEMAFMEEFGFIYFIALIVISVLIIYGVSTFGAKSMITGIQRNASEGKKKKLLNKDEKEKSVSFEIFRKEIRDIVKTPIYLFNSIGTGVIFPIALMIPYFTNKEIESFDFEYIRLFLGIQFDTNLKMISIGILTGFLLTWFIGMISNISITSISREGIRIWLLQSLPIKAEQQINGRIMAAMLLTTLTVLPTIILLSVILRLSLIYYLGIILGMLSAAMVSSLIGLMIDVIRPKLNWTNPQQAMKQNFNIFISSILSFLVTGLMVYAGYRVLSKGMRFLPILSIFLVVSSLIVSILVYLFICKIFYKEIRVYNVN